jgi:hypothetical protein
MGDPKMAGKRTEGGAKDRRQWTSPKLTFLGHVGGIVQGGVGKLTTMPADPGESKKTKPSG